MIWSCLRRSHEDQGDAMSLVHPIVRVKPLHSASTFRDFHVLATAAGDQESKTERFGPVHHLIRFSLFEERARGHCISGIATCKKLERAGVLCGTELFCETVNLAADGCVSPPHCLRKQGIDQRSVYQSHTIYLAPRAFGPLHQCDAREPQG